MQAKLTKQDLCAIGLLLIVVVVMFWRYLTPPFPMILPNSTLGTDLDREIWTLSHYLRETFHETGEIALWRPYLMSGLPLFGNPLNPATDPFHWIMGIQAIPLPLTLTLDMVIHFFVGAVGMYLVLRLLCGLKIPSAWVGAIIWGLAPRLIIHMTGGHWWLISSVVWIPYVYFFFHAAWLTRRMIYAVLLGVVMALAAMNNLQYAFYNGLMLIVFSLAYLIRDREQFWRTTVHLVKIGMIALAVMLGLFAVNLLPQLAYVPLTNRVEMTYAEAVGSSLPLAMLIGAFVPSTLRFPEAFLYLSVGAVMLLFAGMGRGWQKSERMWAFGTLIALLLSLGSSGVIYAWLYSVPGMSLFRTPERFYIYVLFGVAALSAFAFERWLNGNTANKLLRPLLLGIGLLYVLLVGITFGMPNLLPFYVFPHGIFAAAIALLLLMRPQKWQVLGVATLITVEILYTGYTLSAPVTEETLIDADNPTIVFLREHLSDYERVLIPYGGVSDMALLANGIYTADGYNGAQVKLYADYLNQAIGCNYTGYSVAAPAVRASADAVRACPTLALDIEALHLLNVRYIILPRSAQLTDRDPVFVHDALYVYDLGAGMGRFRQDESLTALDSGRTANGEWFLVNVAANAPSEWVRSEAYSVGVYAILDGDTENPLPICESCVLQTATIPDSITAGEHLIEFGYEPPSFRVGFFISIGTSVIVIGLIGFYLARGGLRLLKKQ